MRHLLLTLLFSAICFSGCAQHGVDFNGSMENLNANHQPVGWLFPTSAAHAEKFPVALDSIEKKDGKYSISITSSTGTEGYVATSFNIPKTFKGHDVELKGFMKTQQVTDGYAGLWLRVDKDGGVLQFNNMADKAVAGTNDWNEFSIKLPYNDEEAIRIVAGGLLVGKGKMWIDGLKLLIDGKPIEQARLKEVTLAKAQLDTAYANHSGIDKIELSKQRISNLKILAEVWGLLKYHHPAVASGDFNMDAELFRVMPAVVNAKTNAELNQVLVPWVYKFGASAICKDCASTSNKDAAQHPDYGSMFDGKVLNANLVSKLKHIVANPASKKNYYLELVPNVENPVFKHENAYSNLDLPDAGMRLLSLYRYWNMINYFFPYKHLIGGNWEDKLESFIPDFVNAERKQEYLLTTLRLISTIHDTHANIWSAHTELEDYRGKFGLPIRAKFVEDKLVVTGYYADTLGVKQKFKIGDVITSIDGVPVEKLIQKFLPITAASNYATQLRDLPRTYLLRSNNSQVQLDIVSAGRQQKVAIGTLPRTKLNYALDVDPDPSAPAYKVMNGGIAYIFPGKYKNKDLPAIKEAFRDTKGIVVDMRCYPSEFMPFTFVPFIKTKTQGANAKSNSSFVKFTTVDLMRPGTFRIRKELSTPASNEYKGKVVVIVNELTQSQAEYTTMAFQSSPNVTVIGSTTAAADGNVSAITLPGGISTMISGIGVLYPDGTETQRKGIRIDYEIKPTIQGIKEGKDELLEKAIQIINGV